MRRRRGSAFTAGIAIAVLSSGYAPAMAGVTSEGGFKYVVEENVIAPGTTETFAAPCPGRSHVLGGGMATEAGFADAFISSSYPYDGPDAGRVPDDGWKTKLSSFDRYVEVSPSAVCSRLEPVYRRLRQEVPAEGSAEEPVPCGEGRAIVHGGFRGPTSVRPGSSYPSDNGDSDLWSLRADNVSDKARMITAYAVCSDELEVTYSSSPVNVMSNTQAAGHADCPPNAPNVVGGGQVNFSPIGDIRAYRDFPDFSPQPAVDTWQSDLENEGSPTSYTIWADCVPNL